MNPPRLRLSPIVALALLAGNTLLADDYKTKVVAQGLHRPTGIAVQGSTIYFSEIPTPGVAGGRNAVKELRLGNGAMRTIHQGEPEPVNIAVDKTGVLYWTCKSAGVILEQAARPGSGAATPLLTGLAKPSGIAIDRMGNVYFTQVPTPGAAGGSNTVSVVSAFDSTDVTILSKGEPEPTDIAASNDGVLYWTCKTAGVILTRNKCGDTTLFLGGLASPTGIALDEPRRLLYWTEVPTPGVAGAQGGRNKVWEYDLRTKQKTLVNSGDPEPTDIAVAANGRIYWTCSSAGVIVEARRDHDRDRN
ncbi:NHL repeat-containing protein [Horticoccus sp. 23ND18S-11]|uniref:hypothetical protein n=1 Tax=Horticoccus sp. 23ND18S-11 TaxID=3391832 RepID=UPI0039C8D042